MSPLRLLSVAVLLALVLAAGPPAAADWIVTTDGERIETRGPWEVRGRLVVLTRANGELASMRLSNVDLEASRRATEEAARAAETPPSEAEPQEDRPRSAKIVLTDDDFTTVRRPLVETEEEPEQEAAEEASPLAVITSEDAQDPETGGVVVSGILANRSNDALANVALTVRLLDVEGELLEEMDAELSSPSLSPGARASFRARFPDVLAFAEAELEPRSVALLTGSEPTRGEP